MPHIKPWPVGDICLENTPFYGVLGANRLPFVFNAIKGYVGACLPTLGEQLFFLPLSRVLVFQSVSSFQNALCFQY